MLMYFQNDQEALEGAHVAGSSEELPERWLRAAVPRPELDAFAEYEKGDTANNFCAPNGSLIRHPLQTSINGHGNLSFSALRGRS